MERHFTFFKVLQRLFLALLPVAFVGWLLGVPFQAVSAFLLIYALWNAFYQQRLNRWLWLSRTMHPPKAPGAWSDIYDGIYRTLRRSQFRRRNLAMILHRFREAAEAIPDAGMVLEANGNLVWSNKLAQHYFGLKWPTDKGIRITSFIRHPRFVKYFRKGDFKDPITLSSPVGDGREIEIRIMPYAGEQWLVMARDVTRLNQLERVRKDFVANVSHELKTPLTVMQGYLELMEEPTDLPPKQLKKAVHDISVQTRRMQLIVEQLLALSRMEAKGIESSELVDVGRLIHRYVAELRHSAESKQQSLTVNVVANSSVLGNEEKLAAAIQNLITNAMKYTQVGGHIEVSLQPVAGGIEFAVQDNGPGIAAEHLPRLTERFYRVTGDRNSATGGTGLGLSIVKHALEQHRAQLQISSTLGKGSRFSFVIPHTLIPNTPS